MGCDSAKTAAAGRMREDTEWHSCNILPRSACLLEREFEDVFLTVDLNYVNSSVSPREPEPYSRT